MPYASQTAARDAIYTFMLQGLNSKLSAYAPWEIPIIFEDKQTPVPTLDKRPYLRVRMQHLPRTGQVTVGGAGGRRFRYYFQITVKVLTDLGRGMDDYVVDGTAYPGSDTVAQAVQEVFRGRTLGVDSAQFYRIRPLEEGEFEGRYLQSVLIFGDYDQIG